MLIYPHIHKYMQVKKMTKTEKLRKEIERQIAVAKTLAVPREKWKNPPMLVFGAYHLGRLEALEEVKRLAKEAAGEAD